MKRMNVIAAVAAVVTLTGCAMNEVEFGSNEIQFSAKTISSKALINPTGTSGSFDFPADLSFGVIATHKVGEAAATTFMNNVEITKETGVWKADTEEPYLWPSAGTLDFYAYHPYSATAASITGGFLSLTGINLGSSIGNQNDPLVALSKDQIAASRPMVGLAFKHIASQIVISAKDVTTAVSLQGKITLKEVKVNGMKISGDYLDGTTTGKGSWSNLGSVTSFTVFSGSRVLGTTEDYLSAESFSSASDGSASFVVVPQPVSTQTISVVYDVKAFSCNDTDYPARSGVTATVVITGNANNEFACGKRYVYHLGFSLDGVNNEVMFSPTVSGWETEDIDNILFDCSPVE